MIVAFIAAGGVHLAALGAPSIAPPTSPLAIVQRYESALAAVKEPRTFTVEFTLEQTGMRSVDQTHRIFRAGSDERDEIIAVNGTRAPNATVRIFHARPYRYSVTKLAPRTAQYDFAYVGPHKNGHHVDYVFRLTPKTPKTAKAFRFTEVTIDGVTYLPGAVAFASGPNVSGSVTFGKSEKYWVATSAGASAGGKAGIAHERLTFSNWRFPKTLPRSTFAARPLPTVPPG
jgi:outer membrane lipoprotein-sorting protein